ncbi:hypothetical protein [Phaeodactylibacter sp.]|jgi:hypothetical protein|uniref:hypothetical protein n=1 Tax=Phaeodactylibacter sp. TaxID=1940289 RepID=UPI0025E6F621|nr:hypothetical protein [Phaeodactylibacter sp.]MCI4647141.1 hypothetical protein [Phaeodactylibacter sp.]MCI5090871.1 hypothetical protein [Phaeodactylibacter sp.]
MWSKEISIKTGATKTQIWKLWTDVPNWNIWDKQVVSSSLDGEFVNGQTGQLIPKGGPKSIFELVDVKHEERFTSRSKLPLGKMDFLHYMEEADGELIITHKVEISGALSFLFGRLIGKKLFAELPETMNNLSNLAQAPHV